MKITNLEVLQMGSGSERSWNWTFVKVETDEGITGYGESSLQYKDRALKAELEDMGRFLIGKDPFAIEGIWSALHRRVTWTGGPVTVSAISGIELALWDIKGKALGVPVYELLGGKMRDRVPAYANAWFVGAQTPEDYARKAKDVVEAGYTALKFYPFIRSGQVISPENEEYGIACVESVREAIGPKTRLGIDVRARLNMWSAIRMAQAIEPFNIAWYEEPVLYDNVDAMAEIARAINIPVATGEQLYTRWEFRTLLEKNAARIIQPDICHAGGIMELKKIAAMAEMYYVTMSPHNSNGPISTIASLHLDACVPNCFMQEIFVAFLPLYNQVLTKPIEIEDGYAKLPTEPGWGMDIIEDVVLAHPPQSYDPVEGDHQYY